MFHKLFYGVSSSCLAKTSYQVQIFDCQIDKFMTKNLSEIICICQMKILILRFD